MLVLSRHRDEVILIGNEISVMVVDIRGDKVRIGIEAPPDMRVDREEARRAIEREGGTRKKFHGPPARPLPPEFVSDIARDMCAVILNPQATADEKRRAVNTLQEALA